MEKNATNTDLISSFLEDHSEENMDLLVQSAKANALSVDEISSLATGLADSGTSIRQMFSTFDVPSTGGPSSLSTLLCPLILRHWERPVLKLGVPGRPAGGIDVLAQLTGYNFSPNLIQIEKWVRDYKYVHFISNEAFAPLDAALFAFRKKRNAVNVPELAVASLLSKKIAVGLSRVGLDVRAWEHGNFGSSIEEAKYNARIFNMVAKQKGIGSICFITNLQGPLQPFIGRGEALLALHTIFTGEGDPLLLQHVSDCIKMASLTGEVRGKQISNSELRDCFIENIVVQGSSEEIFLEYIKYVADGHKAVLRSKADGYLDVDLAKIRDAVVAVQNSVSTQSFPDPCGIILSRTTNEFIYRGDPLCTIRCIPSHMDSFASALLSGLHIVDIPIHKKPKTDMEVIE